MKTVAMARAERPILTPTQWAYLAGIFDGKGSVHLAPAHNKSGRLKTFQLCATVVCGTSETAIRKIAETVGSSRRLGKINGSGNKRQAWRLRLYSAQAQWFLEGVLPFLLMKGAQARLGINHHKAKPSYIGARCSAERAQAEAKSKAILTELNRRGAAA